MARFRHRESGVIVGATRLKSAKQVETADRGWVQAGVGNWEVTSQIPGMRPLVLQDPDFRAQYEAEDQDGRVALTAPQSDTPQQTPQDAPAPPDHTAAQNLPSVPTARDYAAEHQEQTAPEPDPEPEETKPAKKASKKSGGRKRSSKPKK